MVKPQIMSMVAIDKIIAAIKSIDDVCLDNGSVVSIELTREAYHHLAVEVRRGAIFPMLTPSNDLTINGVRFFYKGMNE
jgi:hypothetical protein